MRVLVEALAAEFGGIRTYVEGLLPAWALAFPEDDVHVVARPEAPEVPGVTAHRVPVRGPAVLGRPVAQTRAVSSLVASLRPDVVLATLPATTLRHPGGHPRVPLAVVVYDLRHELRPSQFPAHRRALRSVAYRRSYALADGFCAISQRTLDDLHQLHPSTRSRPAAVTHLGADHVDAWPAPGPGGHVVTFAHQSNKNLNLVLDGWARLGGSAPPLVVTGVAAGDRAAVEAGIARRQLSGVTVAPFLADDEFHALVASASVVLFPSDFEGFGLPVVEAMRLGIPVVIGPEPATQEVAGGHAFSMSGFSPDALAVAMRAALDATPEQLSTARAHAAAFTWRRTASQTRDLLASLL